MARHTWAGVSGMSACRTPYGRSASMTALTTAGGDPTGGDPPTPVAPVRRRGDGGADLPGRALQRGRQQVVHERAAQAVAVGVEGDGLHQRHPDPVGEAAVHLTLDDHRVETPPAVVHCDEPADIDLAGARIHVD